VPPLHEFFWLSDACIQIKWHSPTPSSPSFLAWRWLRCWRKNVTIFEGSQWSIPRLRIFQSFEQLQGVSPLISFGTGWNANAVSDPGMNDAGVFGWLVWKSYLKPAVSSDRSFLFLLKKKHNNLVGIWGWLLGHGFLAVEWCCPVQFGVSKRNHPMHHGITPSGKSLWRLSMSNDSKSASAGFQADAREHALMTALYTWGTRKSDKTNYV